MLLSDYGKHVLLPEKRLPGLQAPEHLRFRRSPGPPRRVARRLQSRHADASANFEYSGWLTEANHLGNVAYRVGKKLEWDAENMHATNAPEAERFLTPGAHSSRGGSSRSRFGNGAPGLPCPERALDSGESHGGPGVHMPL